MKGRREGERRPCLGLPSYEGGVRSLTMNWYRKAAFFFFMLASCFLFLALRSFRGDLNKTSPNIEAAGSNKQVREWSNKIPDHKMTCA